MTNDPRRTFYLQMLGYSQEEAENKPPIYDGPDELDEEEGEEE